jgi:hypothetical protein
MLGSKRKRFKKDEGEENGLFQSDSLLEYQNKSLCTLITDLKEKLKSKEESYNILSSQFNSTIEFLNIFTSTINSLNDEISKALNKNKISFDTLNKDDVDKKKKTFSSVSQYLNDLLEKSKEKKEEKNSNNNKSTHDSNNNKIIIDNTDDEEMKDANEKNKDKNKNKEYEPMVNLSRNLTFLIDNLIPILKLNETQYENLFSNIDEEIAKRNKELEEISDELNKNLSNVKLNLDKYKSENVLQLTKISNLEEKVETLTQEKFKLNRKLNTFPPMPLLVVEGYANGKPVGQHDCICVICSKVMKENQNSNNNNEIEKQSNKEEEKKDNEMNIEKENIKTKEEMEEIIKENEALKKKIQELHENLEDISGKTEITEENILNSKHFQSLISQAENILLKLEKMKEINNNLQRENNSLNQKKENEILQLSNSFNEQLEKSSQKLLEMSKTI